MKKYEILFNSLQVNLFKSMDSDNQESIQCEAVFCDICDELNEINSKCSHLKALSYEEFDRFEHENNN